MVQLHAGHWGFPKGHAEHGETPLATAVRELREETGLRLNQLLSPTQLEERYSFFHQGELIDKSVFYYIAKVVGELRIQSSEIKDARWILLTEAESLATHPSTKNLCRKVLLFTPPK